MKNEEVYKEIGKRLKEIRKQHKMTQKELASVLNISQSTVNHYEKGNRKITLSFVKDFAEYFSIKEDDLIGIKKGELFNKCTFGFNDSELKALRDKEDELNIPLVAWLHLTDTYFKGSAGPKIYCINKGAIIEARPVRLNRVAFTVYNAINFTEAEGVYLVGKYGFEWFINRQDAERYLKSTGKNI